MPRHEDARLLRGRGRFADDVNRTGQAYVRIVRSPVAHARIDGVDTAEAAAMPGVVAVVTGADVADVPPIPVRLPNPDHPLDAHLQPVLAYGEVRYVGEPIAAVVAEDPYLAEDAAELVELDLTELDAVLDAEDGVCAATLTDGFGDVDAAFAGAAHVVEAVVEVGRHAAVPLEPRGLVAAYDADRDRMEVWGASKVPNFNRGVLAGMLGMAPERVRLYAMDGGGGFGARGEFYPEDFLVPWLARRLGRPVKWTEDRAEALVALNHSRQQRHRVAAAFDDGGTLLGLRDEIWHDNGAYARTHGLTVPDLTVAMLPGPYRLPAYGCRLHMALTHKTPCGTYRAPGRYEGTFAREQLFDVAADRLGIDPVELRRRNLLTPAEIPHTRPLNALGTSMVLDAGDYPKLLDAAVARTDGWRAEAERLRADGMRAGVGLAVFLEKSGLGPYETADVVVDASGAVRVHSGGTSLGQGIETVLAQIAAERLTVPDDRIEVVNGDTDLQPYGLGSWASRSTVVGGGAVVRAADAVVDKARRTAALLLEADPADLELADGRFTVKGSPDAAVTLGEAAAARMPGGPGMGPDEEPGLAARRVFTVDHMTYPYGVHVALVAIDPGTGAVRVPRYLVAYEVGRAVNPKLVEGQLVGGAAQGLGGALYEEFRYDEAGQPLATTFMDYLMPTASETVPYVETLVTEDAPSPDNPLGTKGAGEGGITAAGAVLASAVRAALGLRGTVGRLPLTPSRVAELMDGAGPSASDLGGHNGGDAPPRPEGGPAHEDG
ncbi:MAG TPA: xanthine dehydrogenase family protein molybdopterin-binding subunit [Streptosporangiaceae bacterium]